MNISDRQFRKDLHAGLIGLALLAVLARTEEDLYPYDIAKRLRELSGELPFSPGAIYPLLRSMAARGWLASRIVPSYSGPPRRYYRVTEEGRAALHERLAAWQRAREFVEAATQGMLGR